MKGIHVRTMGSVCSYQEQSILVTAVNATVQASSVQDVTRVSRHHHEIRMHLQHVCIT